MTRVLVVDDSAVDRTVVGDALAADGDIVEEVREPDAAVAAVAAGDPDVVVVVADAGTSSELAIVERIMATRPTPILAVTSPRATAAEESMAPYERGAMAVLERPDPPTGRALERFETALRETVTELSSASQSSLAVARTTASAHRTAARTARDPDYDDAGDEAPDNSRANERPRSADESTGQTVRAPVDAASNGVRPPLEPATVALDGPVSPSPVVVIGASTGGPRLVEHLLASLPRALCARIVVVQHMPGDFTDRFAARLDQVSAYDVSEATAETAVAPGESIVAPGGKNLEVRDDSDGTLVVAPTHADRRDGARPSVDAAMESAAAACSSPLLGVVLSGMGRDGARGVEAISDAGGTTFAQDERTAAVFGMPRRAIETDAVDAVVPIDRLARRIVGAVAGPTDDAIGGVETNG
ncbi:chemotaxis protein CheB [Halovivax limisalsi]|uniref:chemotaxis protein CheB n=1 Tax=Halovivax limisalsi TaxID=1453760 RepID=UPI001FFC94A1|nr:chemotaxis protein CheB [Halovivax limisalsi]